MEIFNVLAAASASFVFGAIWYMVLSDPWMTASGVARDADGKPLNSSNPRPYILSAISAIVVAGMMRHVLAASGVTSIPSGAIAWFGIGAFLIVLWIMMNNEFAGKPFQLTVIDGGYAVIGCTLMRVVLMAF
ncbi:DUF1761 domain-containing protein [uncultured Planktomarina sp.]|uniref:DUF1761 domain-containing protein n=1 Tax=uncultured Planktomarina sp. TaxID=1538529 RepID=UPI003261446E